MNKNKNSKNNKEIKISLDFDEVLWDLKALTHRYLLKEYNFSLNDLDKPFGFNYFTNNFPKIIDGLWNNETEYSKGKFILGAVEFVYELIDLYGTENIQIITASLPNVINFKNKIIQRTFGDIRVIHSKEKHPHSQGTILIDDAIHNIKDHLDNNNEIGILFDKDGHYNWNKEPIENQYDNCYRMTSYHEILCFLKELQK